MSANVSPRILVVDDDATITKLVSLVLMQAGFLVTSASSGEEGLLVAERLSPDLAILDVMLPGMDGYTLCRKLREYSSTSLMPILILTARDETREKLLGFNAGPDDYLPKPFESPELIYRVRSLLARSAGPPEGTAVRAAGRGKLWAVFGAEGGVGKTTIAINLAIATAQLFKTRVVVVDADFSFGDVGAHLNLRPARTILDIVSCADELSPELIGKVLIPHETGVYVLLRPDHPEDSERILPDIFKKILSSLTASFDYVIADCPSNYDDLTLVLLETADQIVMVLTPEIGPVKNSSTFLDLAVKLEIPPHKIQIVLNRANSEAGIAIPEIERALQKPIPLRLNSGGHAVVKSVNRGVPMLVEQPQHPFSKQLVCIAEQLRTPILIGAH